MRAIALFTFAALIGAAQDRNFVGVVGGVTTLSADGKSVVGTTESRVSLYKPENGGALRVFGGRHFTQFLSIEGNYGWTANSLALTATEVRDGRDSAYDETRRGRQDSAGADLMLYFRGFESRYRPYLTAGTGWTHFSANQAVARVRRGSLPLPAAEFASNKAHLRVAVGIDVKIAKGWAWRFTFSETIIGNPISRQLTPPGDRNLASFQNLFGLVKTF